MIERSVKYMPNLQPFFPGATSGVVVSNAVNAAGSCVRVAAAGGVSRKDKGQSLWFSFKVEYGYAILNRYRNKGFIL